VQCDGSCSKPNPPGYGQACGSCGGKIQCNGSCSISTPSNLGRACGECGGQITCAGTCSNNTPRCPNGYVPEPGGQCRSAEKQVHRAELSIGGAAWDRCDPCGCGLSFDKTINIPCGPGMTQSSHHISKLRGGNANCSGVWANNSNRNDCSVRIHVGTSLCDNFICGVTVNAVSRRPQCTP
jgi:hypothetical protein